MQTLQRDDEPTIESGGGRPNLPVIAIVGVVGVVIVVALALVALFLPPLNLAASLRCGDVVDANNPALAYDDGSIVTWIGPDSVRLCFDTVSRETFEAGEAGGKFSGALEAIPPYLQLKSGLYTLDVVNSNGSVATLDIPIPADATSSYQTLDLYRWDDQIKQWVYVPGRVDPARSVISTDELPDNVALFSVGAVSPLVSTILEANDSFDPSAGSGLNIVMPTGLNLQPDGTIAGALIGGWQLNAGYAVVPVIRSTDSASLSGLLNNQASVALHVADLKAFVVSDGYHGVAIDYRDVNPADRAVFAQFIAELAAGLHPYNKMVVVVLPPPTDLGGTFDSGGYDWRAIGKSADVLVITPGDNPADFAANGKLNSLLTWAVGETNRFKLHVASSALSAQDSGGSVSLITYDEALAGFGKVKTDTAPPEGLTYYTPGSQIGFALDGSVADLAADQNTGAYTYTLNDAGGARKVWIVMGSTIRARLDMANAFHVGGLVVNNLFVPGNNTGALTAINEFKANAASSVPNSLSLLWTVNGSNGQVASQNVGLGTPFLWQADAQGDFTVQGAIVSGGSSDRGSVGVKVAELPTTPPPTRPPVVQPPSGTQPAATQPPAATTPPPAPSGAVVGDFQLGGQTHDLSHPGQMKQAGMSWVKFQHKWGGPGDSGGSEAGRIANAKGQGFRVLISVPGPANPTSIDYGAYVNFLKELAAQGPDAIEVWNEMNLDREWPANDVNGASYVNNMLAPAYNAIKSVNPAIMVISGAPAPSGAFNGCGSVFTGVSTVVGCDDWFYLQQMRDAGAANYMDCMGAHYNEGIIPPSQNTGDPRSEHYTRYLMGGNAPAAGGMFYTYYLTIGKPVCFTELGYVSPDGYGALPANFAWGGNTSVDEQAAWLAEAATILSQTGKVPLMIVFNVDIMVFTSDDPQGGYAIIRPGGGCPACATLDAVMP